MLIDDKTKVSIGLVATFVAAIVIPIVISSAKNSEQDGRLDRQSNALNQSQMHEAEILDRTARIEGKLDILLQLLREK